jgi:hypothetical protein
MSCTTQKSSNQYSKIEYEAIGCFGFCPIYKMTINPDRSAVLEAEHFNFTKGNSKADFSKPREGTFTATIKKEDFDKLVALINDTNPTLLNSYYGDKNMTDMATSYLRLDFKDGNKKEVEDYGKNGSQKLEAVYNAFEDLKKSQTWTKIK